jgi:site-specific DNA recombinase
LTYFSPDSNTFTRSVNIETVLIQENDNTLADIYNRLAKLQTQLLKLASTKADYEDVADEICRLHKENQKLQVVNTNHDEIRKRIADMIAFLHEQPTLLLNTIINLSGV